METVQSSSAQRGGESSPLSGSLVPGGKLNRFPEHLPISQFLIQISPLKPPHSPVVQWTKGNSWKSNSHMLFLPAVSGAEK